MKPLVISGGANEHGSAMIFFLVMVMIFSIAIGSALQLVSHDVRLTREFNDYKRAVAAAEAGVDRGVLGLRNLVIDNGSPLQSELDAIRPPTITGFTFTSPNGTASYSIKPDGPLRLPPLTEGRWKGLSGTSQRYIIRSGVTGSNKHGVVITQTLQRLTIPVFQFGIFYENDLEILPGPSMTFAGPVHTNGSLYLGAENSLHFDNNVTCRREIYRRRKDASTYQTGYVYIKDDTGTYQNMRLSGASPAFLEHSSSNWPVLSLQRWDGNMIDSSHGVPYLRLPIPLTDTPAEIKERAVSGGDPIMENQRFENKAGLKLYRRSDGTIVGTLSDGTNFPITYTIDSTNYTVAQTASFGDMREGTGTAAKTVHSLDINVQNLINHPQFPTGDGIVVYTWNAYVPSNTLPVVRLYNGATLPANGLTVASYNPVYIRGNYNSSGTAKPSLVAGDAITILSNAWDDAKSTQVLSSRGASNTTVKSVLMVGNTTTVTGTYNGGVENVMRFLENWSGDTLTFRGSILCLWSSRLATKPWQQTGIYYNPPTRDWGYDSMYSDSRNAPPGIPTVFGLEVLTWSVSTWTAAEKN